MSFSLELTGRRALVTGGTKGVGAAVVESLRNAGVTVVTKTGPKRISKRTPVTTEIKASLKPASMTHRKPRCIN